MTEKRLRFRIVLPLFCVSVWILLVALPFFAEILGSAKHDPVLSVCFRLWNALSDASPARFLLTLPEEQRSWIVMGLSLPAFPAELLESLGTWPMSWSPPGLSIFQWRMFTFPFLALPAWFYVGRGLDSLRSRTTLSVWELLSGVALSAIFALMCFGMSFMTPPGDQDSLLKFITGGALLWAFLFGAVPLAAVQEARPKLGLFVQITSGIVFCIAILWGWANSPISIWRLSSPEGTGPSFSWKFASAFFAAAVSGQVLSWLMMRAFKLGICAVAAAENAV
jgi:hypothetical protein